MADDRRDDQPADRSAYAGLETREKRNRLPFLLAALAAIVLIVLLARACSERAEDDAVVPADTAGAPVAAAPTVAATPRPYVNGSLAAYLAGDQPLPYTYELATVNFDSGSAKLGADADAEIADVAAALRARSTARVSLRGYADPEGDADTNRKLSQERAEAVQAALVKAGANVGQIELAGLGETGDAATRANRRVELTVTAR